MAAVAWYRQCTSCKKLMPYIQIRCDCGERFTGSERIFKVCPACGSVLDTRRLRCDCGYLFVFRRFLDKQCAPEATQSKDAYRAGVMAERAKNDAEWDRFFKTAQLKNTISGTPIRSREDFYKWAEEFAAAKAERDRRAKEEADRLKAQRQKKRGVLYTLETPDGDLVTLSETQLSAYLQKYGAEREGGQE